ncbi:MAG: beta-galactosidase, partial [Planctomycetes bacterium]|nr:beta-galactosidase [Planctomycetota bacterium]
MRPLALVLAAALAACTAPPRTFTIGESDFLLDGHRLVIRSGEMHAARVPPDYWRHRLRMVKAMGCNTVCAYLFWNQHEPAPGVFDFTGPADVARYCRIAQEEGLHV